MRRNLRIFEALFLCICLVMGLTSHALAQDRVRARIGVEIKSENRVSWSKAEEGVKAGDLLRIHIIPKEDLYIYLIHSDKNHANLLNKIKSQKETLIVLPSNSEYYQFDGSSELESFTVIFSPTEFLDILTLFNSGGVARAKWEEFENKLIKQSRIDMSKGSTKPYAIAGNVRGSLVSIKKPRNQTDAEGDDISLQIMVYIPDNVSLQSPLTFSATNLPSGLSIDPTTGLITGTIARGAAAGTPYQVTVSVSAGTNRDSAKMQWNIIPPPELRTFSGTSLLVKKYEFTVKK